MKYFTTNALGHENERIEVTIGTPVRVKMPYSEVCMHLGIAEQYRDVVLMEGHYTRVSARILRDDWNTLEDSDTLDITPGEAGILTDRVGPPPPLVDMAVIEQRDYDDDARMDDLTTAIEEEG